MSTLRDLQSKHVRYTGQLIAFATEQGYELTWGETLRTPEQAMHNAATGAGISNSLHLIKLAVDLSLFKDGVFLTTVEDYKPLGEYWESLDPLCSWGGRFTRPDADHFAITYQGVR
jgi:hypothetical protein